MSQKTILLCAMTLSLGAGCASRGEYARQPSAPAPRVDEVSATVTADIDAPLAEVFDYVVREDTPARDLRSYGPVAGVRGSVRLTEGGWDHAGARRIVVLDDDSTLVERIELLDRPRRFGYRVSDFSSVVKNFATEGHGSWDFASTPAGTHVVWTYTFHARSCPSEPVLRAMVAAMFKPYMERGLHSIAVHIEGESAVTRREVGS
jgi:hypothetical protein